MKKSKTYINRRKELKTNRNGRGKVPGKPQTNQKDERVETVDIFFEGAPGADGDRPRGALTSV